MASNEVEQFSNHYPINFTSLTPKESSDFGKMHGGDQSPAIQRYVDTTAIATSRSLSFVSGVQDFSKPEPQFVTVLKGRNDTDFDANQEPEACSGTTESTAEEGLELHGGNIQQDTDDTCSEVSAVNPQSHSPSINSYPNQSSEEDSQDGKKGEVNCQLNVEEPLHKDKYNIHVVTGMITKWKNNPKRPAGLVISKAVLESSDEESSDDESSEENQPNFAKVLYQSKLSKDWKSEFPLYESVEVNCEKEKYQKAVHDRKGCLKLLDYTKVPPVDHQIFNKWEQLDGSIHCHSVVAYLEDENFGYIVEEYLENGMATVINKIIRCLQTIAPDEAKLHKYNVKYLTTLSWWRGRLREQERLKQLIRDLVKSLINAIEHLHQFDYVALSLLKVSNLFVRFNCNCWASPTCFHGSSGVTVMIRNCELAYPVGSLVDRPTTSKALELLDPLHKYKRAEMIYDDLDLVIFITELTKISGDTNCEMKLNAWTSNIADAVFTDPPPVEDVRLLCEECGITHNDTIKMTDYLKVSAVHYAGEHEVSRSLEDVYPHIDADIFMIPKDGSCHPVATQLLNALHWLQDTFVYIYCSQHY